MASSTRSSANITNVAIFYNLTENSQLNNSHFYVYSCSAVVADKLLVAESFLVIILSVFSLFVNGVFLSAIRQSTGHTSANVRALLVSANAAIIVRSIYFTGRGFYLLSLAYYGFDRLAVPPLLCASIELPYAVSSMCMITSLLAIGVERLAATMRKAKRKSASQEGVHRAVKVCIIFCWLQGFIVYGLMLMAKFLADGVASPNLCYCIFPLVTKFYATAANNVYFGLQEIAIMIAYVIIYAKNRHRLSDFSLKTKEHSLNDRYGVWTNVRTTRMLLPAATLHAFVFLIVLFGGIPAYGEFLESPNSKSLDIILSLSLFSCIDLIAHPLLCVRFNERYRSIIGEKWPRFFWLFGAYRDDRRVGPMPAEHKTSKQTSTPFSITVPSTFNSEHQGQNNANDSKGSGSNSRSNQSQKDLVRKLSKKDNTAGKKTIIDFRLDPEDNDTILNKMWNKYAPQS